MKKIAIIISIALVFTALAQLKDDQQVSAATSLKFVRTGQASWYSRSDEGINERTANNEVFNDRDLTCAIWGVEFNRKIKVTNLENGKSVIVRVNDRGPHERFIRAGRIIDLTKSAFERLSPSPKGLIDVSIEFL